MDITQDAPHARISRAPEQDLARPGECKAGFTSGPTSPSNVIEALGETEEVPRLLVTCKITSRSGQAQLAQKLNEHTASEAETDYKGYLLRRRAADDTSHATTHCYQPAELDITAKPFARGCYGCASLYGSRDLQCSLLTDERAWPCQACRDSDSECELIVAPTRKRACEPCQKRRVVCSYTHTRNHGSSCAQCAAHSHPCVAGPVQAFIKPRIRYDRARRWPKDPYPHSRKTPEACAECSGEKTKCQSLRDHDGRFRRACTSCLEKDRPCTISVTHGPRHDAVTTGAEIPPMPSPNHDGAMLLPRAAETRAEPPGRRALHLRPECACLPPPAP